MANYNIIPGLSPSILHLFFVPNYFHPSCHHHYYFPTIKMWKHAVHQSPTITLLFSHHKFFLFFSSCILPSLIKMSLAIQFLVLLFYTGKQIKFNVWLFFRCFCLWQMLENCAMVFVKILSWTIFKFNII